MKKYILLLLVVKILASGCKQNNQENGGLLGYINKNIIDTQYVNYTHYKPINISPDSMVNINNLACEISKFRSGSGDYFLLLHNKNNDNYSFVTYTPRLFELQTYVTNFLNKTSSSIDMFGIEDFLTNNYPILDTTPDFLSGCDSLFRHYLLADYSWKEKNYLGRLHLVKSADDLTIGLLKKRQSNVIKNMLMSSDSANVKFNLDFLESLVKSQLNNKLSFIFNIDGTFYIFRIFYKNDIYLYDIKKSIKLKKHYRIEFYYF